MEVWFRSFSFEKRVICRFHVNLPGCIWDEKLPSLCGDCFINHCKDPYSTTSIMESKRVFFVAVLPSFIRPKSNMSPEKGPYQKERIVFQPSIFSCYVSFREGRIQNYSEYDKTS